MPLIRRILLRRIPHANMFACGVNSYKRGWKMRYIEQKELAIIVYRCYITNKEKHPLQSGCSREWWLFVLTDAASPVCRRERHFYCKLLHIKDRKVTKIPRFSYNKRKSWYGNVGCYLRSRYCSAFIFLLYVHYVRIAFFFQPFIRV